ncbi:MAG: UDP-N-acetylmuramoyl-L-alanine--D-glutamate ligase [Oscillospiraceae bacterium]
MLNKIENFFKCLHGKKIAFIGAGVSHKECIEMFCENGAIVTLCDKKSDIADFGEYANTLCRLNVRLSLGEDYLNGLKEQDLIMRTPGFEYYTKELQEAKAEGCEVTSEMQLFFELCPCKIVAVTGSDGKTTTTTLISEILKKEGYTVHLGGNLGRALLPIIKTINTDDIAVVELSSFQLISMHAPCNVAVVTNVTPNHLDHHKDMREYIDAKRNILLYQPKDSLAVLGYENEITREMSSDVKGECAYFTRKSIVENGAYLTDKGVLTIVKNCVQQPVVHKSEMLLRGEHNVENMLAAFAATKYLASTDSMADVARSFSGVEHRIEPVRTLNGVKYYNDSIATSPTRVIAGLRAFNEKLIIIAGGYDKHIPFEPMAKDVNEHVKLLILTGATADKIEQAIKADDSYNKDNIEIMRAVDMQDAVNIAYKYAKSGDIVSLSPACASFDVYPNFEARGNDYKHLVNAL